MRPSSIWKAVCAFGILFFTGALLVSANANLYFSTPPKQIAEGERVTIDVRVNAASQSINAVSGAITFPESLVDIVSFPREGSIINLWTREPKVVRGKILFEGVSFNPGYQGVNGLIFRITLQAKQAGTVNLVLSEGAVLANDGQGTNVLNNLSATSFKIVPGRLLPQTPTPTPIVEYINTPQGEKLAALPVIIEYSPLVASTDGLYLKGKGEPNALTKIVFKDVSAKSIGEKLISILQTKKKNLDEVLVNNDAAGEFQYSSPKNIVAGVYNATPFLVDEVTSVEKPGFGVQLLVDDSKIVKALVVLLNVLGLLIPIVALLVVIYFIPWYSFKRMRVIKKKLGLEEAQMAATEHNLENKQ
jgi:hypothetical protein